MHSTVMRKTLSPWVLAALPLALVAFAVTAHAAAPRATDPPTVEPPADQPMSLEEQAEIHFRDGTRHKEKAWKLEEKAAAATGAKRGKLEDKARKAYEKATVEFAYAVQKRPDYTEAFSELGYCLRRRGMYEDALRAYDAALALNAAYTPAIEYRAEAYLALGRIEEAKAAYTALLPAAPEHADELMEAMKRWVEQQRQEPGAVDAATVDDLAAWIEERERVAAQLGTEAERTARRW